MQPKRTRRWEVRVLLFDSMVVQALLYGVEVWGGTISLSAWNEIQKIQKMFLHRQLGIKSSTPYPIMLLEIGARPIKVIPMQRVYKSITNVKKLLSLIAQISLEQNPLIWLWRWGVGV